MSEGPGVPDIERQQARLRLVGVGIVLSGLLTLLVAWVSTRPHGILVFGLAGLAIGWFVLERVQGGATGLSLGLLTGSFGAWLWPQLGGESYRFLGVLLVVVGVLNTVLTPAFHRFGARLAGRE